MSPPLERFFFRTPPSPPSGPLRPLPPETSPPLGHYRARLGYFSRLDSNAPQVPRAAGPQHPSTVSRGDGTSLKQSRRDCPYLSVLYRGPRGIAPTGLSSGLA